MSPVAAERGIRVDIDRVSEDQWDDICLQFRDATLNQTWGFGAIMSGERHLSHVLLSRGDSVLAAAQVRLVTVPLLKAGIAYVGAGPMWRRSGADDDVGDLRDILRALRHEYAVRRRLLLRIQPGVFDDDPEAAGVCSAFAQAGSRRKKSRHQTLFLDLAPSLEDLRRQLHQKWRNCLNSAEKNDLQLREGTDAGLFERFKAIYHDMRERKRYSDHVDIERYAALQRRLPEPLKPWVIVAETGGTPVAGAVFAMAGEAATYLLGATNEGGLRSKASYLVQWRAIQRFKEKGYRRYDLGGVDPDKTPTTYQFKARVCGKHPRICTRVGEFVACESLVSKLAVKSGEMVRSRVCKGSL